VSPVTAECPSCGAPVEFRYDDSFVRVCAYCNAVVGRADRGFHALGRMGDLAATGSPLALLATGRVEQARFELVGRAQIAHARGGGWEEWYARFETGAWGWLSEAQGRFQLSFAAGLPPDLPAFEQLAPGLSFVLSLPGRPPETFTVSEVGEAAYVSAAGELPYQLTPGLRFRYADLSGDRGSTATIDAGVDAGDRVVFFVGREVSLAEFGIAPSAVPAAGPTVAAVHVACVKCAGPLELRAPDRALRVTCPSCGALLDVEQGHLSYLRTLEPQALMNRPSIPLGSTVDLEEPALAVVGCLCRSVRVDEVDYPFIEYLLYHPEIGYRWLVESERHWSYVTPLPAGEVAELFNAARHGGRKYRHFESATARVDRIFGEFYWKVELGESVEMSDYVSPPYILSSEQGGGEINWSRGEWIEGAELARHVRSPDGQPPPRLLPPESTYVAPHQPFRQRGIFAVTIALMLGMIAAAIGLGVYLPERPIALVFEPPLLSPVPPSESGAGDAPLALPSTSTATTSRVHFSQPFELEGGLNIGFHFEAPLNNQWLYVAADLVNEETGAIESFDAQLEYYQGVEGGESWTEGSRDESVHLRAVPAGRYVLRLETMWQGGPLDHPTLDVGLRQGEFLLRWLFAGLGLLLAIPLLVGVRRVVFEYQRWSRSDHPWGES
jgi:Domain of unknown function (DUF4178)